jgi:hypothetical protein
MVWHHIQLLLVTVIRLLLVAVLHMVVINSKLRLLLVAHLRVAELIIKSLLEVCIMAVVVAAPFKLLLLLVLCSSHNGLLRWCMVFLLLLYSNKRMQQL